MAAGLALKKQNVVLIQILLLNKNINRER
jgi:hypothetical protein